MPKPPPMSRTSTRTLSAGILRIAPHSVSRVPRVLAADMHGHAVAIPFGHDRARLHRVHDQPLMDDVERHDMRGRLERRLGLGVIAEAVEADPVAGRALPDLRRIRLQRIVDLGHRRQRVVLDLDQLGGIGAWARVSATTAATASPT